MLYNDLVCLSCMTTNNITFKDLHKRRKLLDIGEGGVAKLMAACHGLEWK